MKVEVNKKDFLIEQTLFGGQSFVWEKLDDKTFVAPHSEFVILAEDLGGSIAFRQVWGKEINLEEYLGLNEEYESALDLLRKDKNLTKPIEEFRGLRVLSQSLPDTLVSFILSSNNTLKNIRNSVFLLKRHFGKRVKTEAGEFYLFPKPEVLKCKEKDLREKAKVGFRAKYLASLELSNLDLDKEEKELMEELKSVKGVGDKIADCVAVFSGKAKTFSPIDTWAKKILRELYGVEYKNYEGYRAWWKEQFGKNAYLAGQFLFEYYRGRVGK